MPRIGGEGGAGDWEACDPNDPRNRRMRASVLAEQGETRLLVDTTPDLRLQCLTFGIAGFDAVLYTHDHADHTHGIDDLRRLHHVQGGPIDIYASAETLASMAARFDYAFAPDPASGYKPFVNPTAIDGPFTVGGIEVIPFAQDHGQMTTLGFRFGAIAYSTDLVGLGEESLAVLEGVDTWIVDALKYGHHPTHASVRVALEMIERVRPRRAVLTHMTSELDYRTLSAELPEGVEPAYDGLVLTA